MKSDIAERAPWLIRRIPAGGLDKVQGLMDDLKLHTVCQSASCPNLGECFHSGTATFLILGGVCTRGCRFCSVPKGKTPPPVDPAEAEHVATAVKAMKLRHAVVTSVTRDDLPDGGADQFVRCIRAIREVSPDTTLEVLTPDFAGDEKALAVVLAARPDVFNHNVETVPRLYSAVRPQADYERSLAVLRQASRAGIGWVKSGLMLGLGEQEAEVLRVLADLRQAGVNCLTLGQYLRPTQEHLPVVDYVHPDRFKALEQSAYDLGFRQVASGPLVRSSYHAERVFDAAPGRPGKA